MVVWMMNWWLEVVCLEAEATSPKPVEVVDLLFWKMFFQ